MCLCFSIRLDETLHVVHVPAEAALAKLLVDLRNCGIDLRAHVQLLPENACLAHYEVVLGAVQGHSHASLEVTLSSRNVQSQLRHDSHHQVNAPFVRASRHAHALAHLLQELSSLQSSVLSLHVLIEVGVWRLHHRRDRRHRAPRTRILATSTAGTLEGTGALSSHQP